MTIVLDNSSSMKGEKISKMKVALQTFERMVNETGLNSYLEYSIVTFDGLNTRLTKDFRSETLDVQSIQEGGLAYLNQGILMGIDELNKRLLEIKALDIHFYKPWFILLTDGQSYENLDPALAQLTEMHRGGKFTYFPFECSNNPMDDRLDGLKAIKKPLIILNKKYEELFQWLFDTIKKRVMSPPLESIKLDANSFIGWTMK